MKIILFGVIISTVVLLLTPNEISIHAFTIKEQIVHIKNAEINNIEYMERVTNRGCDCDNSKNPILCSILFVTYFSLLSVYWICSILIDYYHRFPFYYLIRLMDNTATIAGRLDCDWATPEIENNVNQIKNIHLNPCQCF